MLRSVFVMQQCLSPRTPAALYGDYDMMMGYRANINAERFR